MGKCLVTSHRRKGGLLRENVPCDYLHSKSIKGSYCCEVLWTVRDLAYLGRCGSQVAALDESYVISQFLGGRTVHRNSKKTGNFFSRASLELYYAILELPIVLFVSIAFTSDSSKYQKSHVIFHCLQTQATILENSKIPSSSIRENILFIDKLTKFPIGDNSSNS